MKQMVVISGKGGAGKTTFTSALAALIKNKVLIDCDVDAADLHLLLRPIVQKRHDFMGGLKATINPELCIKCGQCDEVCRFDAVKKNQDQSYIIEEMSCEGCGYCAQVCPANAITMEEHIDGEWFISNTTHGTLVHAKLGIGAGNSGRLVTLIRREAEKIAHKQNADWIIIDGPPGIGCPVIAATTNTDLALIVTEPTLSGIHDLKRILALVKKFSIPAKIIINKYDLNEDNVQIIREMCQEKGVVCLGEIPYSKDIPLAITAGKIPIEFAPNAQFTNILKNIIFQIIKQEK